MPGNTEEKEKCIEKLVQMERFLPFLDFMIGKINKSNYDLPLECQLGKFQLLKSMIAEKNGKYTWDIILKVEDVIQKLITKLDYKEQNSLCQKESTKFCRTKSQSPTVEESESKTDMASVVSIPSSTTTTISVTNASTSSRITTVDSTSAISIDQITKTSKVFVDRKCKNMTVEDTENIPKSSELINSSKSTNKGFESVECSMGDVNVSEKITFNGDLLSSSREKLLKSLQQQLHGYKNDNSKVSDSNKAIDKYSVSAFSSETRTQVCDTKVKSDSNRTSENSLMRKHISSDSRFVQENTTKPLYIDNVYMESGRGEYSVKQKLREKLTADISEVYKVSGKSVGGSLRSLKEPKKPPVSHFQDDLFKPDKVTEISNRSKSQSENNFSDKLSFSNQENAENKNKYKKEKHSKQGGKGNKTERHGESKKKKEKEKEKTNVLEKLDDDELLDLVKENTQALPHLAKLKLGELRKAVNSSLHPNPNLPDLEGVSDDSFQDLDEFMNDLNNITSGTKSTDEKEVKTSRTYDKPSSVSETTEKTTKGGLKDLEPFEGDPRRRNDTDDLDDEDFAQKLIEDLTPAPGSKKKESLEPPLPCTEKSSDLMPVVTGPCVSERDPRKKKFLLQSSCATSCTLGNTPESGTRMDTNHSVGVANLKQTGFETFGSQMNSFYEKLHGNFENCRKEETRLPHPNHFNWNQDNRHYYQYGNRYPSVPYDPRFPNNFLMPNVRLSEAHNEIPVNIPCRSYEPRSYAEYKRMKRAESEKRYQQEAAHKEKESTETLKSNDIPTTAPDKHQTLEIQSFKNSDSCSKNKLSKTNNINRFCDDKGKTAGVRRQADHSECSLKESSRRKSSEDFRKEQKIGNDRRISSDSDELVSPLEKLYEGEEKPKTGRGYGLQNFKIPKKNREHSAKTSLKCQNENVTKENKDSASIQSVIISENRELTNDLSSGIHNQTLNSKANSVDEKSSTEVEGDAASSEKNKNEADEVKKSSQLLGDFNTNASCESTAEQARETGVTENSVSKCSVSDSLQSNPSPENGKESRKVKCDSSADNNNALSTKDENSLADNNPVISKEEISQEFVEALIRKSFQSGEGRLLLAQAKLFEEFARKLNSKKLKTIQKIINSESESSSSSSDSSSEEERKKQWEKKMKKRKKKLKRYKKIITSSSSSVSEESNNDENLEKKEDESSGISSECNRGKSREADDGKIAPSVAISEIPDKPNNKSKSKDIDVGNCISKKKTKRKQGQKKLLEQILNETPSTEGVPEQKIKPKPKAKGKTELDRLHDDIRNMFICSGVVTATGQRMCRILKESGGNMNNLDIVKESAKMVEEEKLKKGAIRPSRARKKESKSRSQSSDKSCTRDRSKSRGRVESQEDDEEKEQKFRDILENQPVVLLHRVDLDNFGFGIKVSENCISFSRLKGSNTAIRGIPFRREEEQSQSTSPPRRVYLPRNLRKLTRLKEKKIKKGYVGRKLSDIVKGLPLKMAKMKHLKMEELGGVKANKSEMCKSEAKKRSEKEQELANLLNYSFVKQRTEYPCRLCSKVLSNITSHYKNVHPLSEVLISRLNKAEARKAKADSAQNNNYSEDKLMGEGKPKATRYYYCRMCSCPRFSNLHAFFIHVSGHTGEYKYQCPSQDCGVTVQTRDDLKLHILQKHEKRRCEMYNKLTEFFVLPTDTSSTLFGYLCSVCNFVQLNSQNIENHVAREHSLCTHVKIIKIDMSSKTVKNNSSDVLPPKNTLIGSDEMDNAVGGVGLDESSCRKEKLGEIKTYRAHNARKKSQVPTRNQDDGFCGIWHKNAELPSARENWEELNIKPDVETLLACRPVEDGTHFPKSTFTQQKQCNMEGVERSTEEPLSEVKVGPLEVQQLGNCKVSHECFVKGCMFLTTDHDLFEKHIKISHVAEKWDGVCDVCPTLTKPTVPKSFNMEKAWKHLKHHQHLMEEIKTEVTPGQAEITQTEIQSKPNDELLAESNVHTKSESKETPGTGVKLDNTETSNPSKPLLRVRNLLGDRLSTPKDTVVEEENIILAKDDSVPNNSETEIASNEDSPVMFTIENVRSLKCENDEDDEVQIEEVVSPGKKDKLNESKGNNRSVVIRSCPTRKIAIRPEISSALPVEVGKVQIHPTSESIHPVALNLVPSLPPTTSPTSNIILKTSFSVASKYVPILPANLRPPPRLAVTANAAAEENPKKKGRTKVYRPEKNKELSGQTEETESEEKVSSSPLKLHPSPNLGNKKSVKDAKVYQEMLTMTKLCHLFKCMSVECSFTCNNETVFKQHIGLHEARKKIKGEKKCLRTFFFENSSKSKRVYTWQQCAYCSEVLMNTSSALSQHIVKEHGHCIYQCAYCFYRAVSQSYVEIHQGIAHSQTLKYSSGIIYKCKPFTKGPSPSEALEKQGKRQSVRPYICDQCGHKFFITQEFMNHLTTEHQSVTAYTCHICKNLCFKAERLIVHYKLHLYCTYQCPYCLHGTETQKEMLFHLCNFHFSQIPCMYVRDLADNEKSSENQLESLKVIFYENNSLPPQCIVDADVEEEVMTESASSSEISSIAAELGITTEADVSGPVQEITANSKARSLSVESILPNTHFSTENCGAVTSDSEAPSNDREDQPLVSSTPEESSAGFKEANEMSVNLQQKENLNACGNKEEKKNDSVKSGVHKLPLMVVGRVNGSKNVCPANSLKVAEEVPCDKNVKMDELLLNLRKKYKNLLLGEKKVSNSDSCDNLPSVGVSRMGCAKNVYPGKSVLKTLENVPRGVDNAIETVNQNSKTSEDLNESHVDEQDTSTSNPKEELEVESGSEKAESEGNNAEKSSQDTSQPVITNVVSLSEKSQEFGESGSSIIISDVYSLSYSEQDIADPSSSKIVIDFQPKVHSSTTLEPPVIRVEDYILDGKEKSGQIEPEKPEKESGYSDEAAAKSPEIVILEEEGKREKNVLTVTLDSDENLGPEDDPLLIKPEKPISASSDDAIRKEMELLREQMASETDCLLFDDSENEKAPECEEEGKCDESKEGLKSENLENVKDKEESGNNKKEANENNGNVLSRTRYATRKSLLRSEASDFGEKSEAEDGGAAEGSKSKVPSVEGLAGKELFICGNGKCNFRGEEESQLKEHLWVCDLSRESSALVCPHCHRKIKQFNCYVEHIKQHGEKKFFCGLCSFSTAVDYSVIRHLKQKHKCHQYKTTPKQSENRDHFFFYPRNYKTEKQNFEEKGYSPGDEDKLPLQSVYQVNVKCAMCPYFTKVRSNMVRHLKIHAKSAETEGSVVVPSTAPTNPVPCLDTKEKMFDKMTNLAASSQLSKDKSVIEGLSPEEEAKLPQFVAEQMRYKCCLPDCNYITVDDGMLKHHIKALHNEISYYSCPHCQTTVHVDVRHVTLDKIGHHLKHHDSRLYRCAHCIYFHYQKNIVEKHTLEKHPDRRFFVHAVREPKNEVHAEEEHSPKDPVVSVMWKCVMCDFQSQARVAALDHLGKKHNTRSKYKCKLCPKKSNHNHFFASHFASKHPGEKVEFVSTLTKIASIGTDSQSGSSGAESSSEHFDTTPLWQRGAPRVRHIRGILIEEEEVKTKKSKRASGDSESEAHVSVSPGNTFYCPLCTDKKKTFYTKNADCFRSHLYQELNYQQYACMLCGKMFVDKRDFAKHHSRQHPDKPPSMKQTKEDGEIKFWVDKVIAKQEDQMQARKRKLSEDEDVALAGGGGQGLSKRKKTLLASST